MPFGPRPQDRGQPRFLTRYYDPRAGRFTSRDRLGIWGDPLNLGNGYTFVGNNLWTLLDPFGFAANAMDPYEAAIAAPERHNGRVGPVMNQVAARATIALAAVPSVLKAQTTFLPVVNDWRDIHGLAKGTDRISRQELTRFDKGLYAAGVVFGSGPLFKRAKDYAGGAWNWAKRKVRGYFRRAPQSPAR